MEWEGLLWIKWIGSCLDLIANLSLTAKSNPWFCFESISAEVLSFSSDGYTLIIISKPFNPSFSDSSIFSRCCTLYCWLFWLQHLKVALSIFAQMILDKLKRFMTIITFWIQFSRQKSCIITHTIFGQCMVLHHHRKSIDWLTGMSPVQLQVVLGFLRSILLLLTLQGCYSS
jgi:hypothetical protein